MTRSRATRLGWLLPLALVFAACGDSSTASPSARTIPSASPAASVASSGPVGSDAAASEPPASDVSQSDTAWGRIWDGIPAGFPRFAGGRSADDATPEPVSDAYVVEGGGATEIATWLQSSMEGATYSTESLSGPLEDGGFVLDSVGAGDCRIQTTIAPQGGLVLVTVRYGADCPAS